MSLASIIVPVYANEPSLPTLLDELTRLQQGWVDRGLEAVFVVDGSPDRSVEVLREQLPDCPFAAQLVLLSRNFGSFQAIRAGLEVAEGDHFATMAADLQDPVEAVERCLDAVSSGGHDVAVGTRESRNDPLLSRLTSGLFWRLYRRLVHAGVPRGGVDMFACNDRFRRHLLALPERNSSLIGLLFWLGFNRAEVSYVRRARVHGRSAWSFRRRVTYFVDSLFGFSDLPIRLLVLIGVLGVAASTLYGATVVIGRLTVGYPVPGYAATVTVVLFFAGLNSLGLGIIGAYVWRAFENTKSRPGYVVMETWRYDEARS